MAHELESFADGSTAFVTARVPAWHQLGVVTTGCLTAAEVITTARLGGWNVRKIPVAGLVPTGEPNGVLIKQRTHDLLMAA
jgi:hypothetical protein